MAELRICQDCGTAQGYPRPACHACSGRRIAAATLPLAAEIFSLTTVHRAPSAAFAARVPYTLTLVRPAAGGLLLLSLRATPGPPPAIGDRVIIEAEGERLTAVAAAPPATILPNQEQRAWNWASSFRSAATAG